MNSLERFKAKLTGQPPTWADRNIRMVAFGDSVTQGLFINPNTLGNQIYHEVLRRKLAARYLDRTFSMVNAGVAGETTTQGLARIQGDVLDHRPDLVIVCFGLNDSCAGEAGEDLFRRNLTKIVRRLLLKTAVILMTPNMMLRRKIPGLSPAWNQTQKQLMHIQSRGGLTCYVEIIRQVAAHTGTPLADAYAEWMKRDAAGEDVTCMLFLNHPNAEGHRIFAKVLHKTFRRILRADLS
jgi:lysophospholipase L1-like esterase